METVTLFRPVGPKELELIRASGFRAFPPRLPEQPIFYPVTNHAYATQIARDWNVKASGAGFVTRFAVNAEYLTRLIEVIEEFYCESRAELMRLSGSRGQACLAR